MKFEKIKIVEFSDLRHNPEPAQKWIVDGILPAATSTMMAGHGGSGKSILAMQIAVCVAQGRPFMGRPVAKGHVVYFSGEDPQALLRSRIGQICEVLHESPLVLSHNLTVIDAVADPTLFSYTEGRANLTNTISDLSVVIADKKPALVVIDNASDCFDGNENDRRQVRGFIHTLAAMTQATQTAVLLLVHVDKASARSHGQGQNYSGSTAWNNSVRSRLTLAKDDTDPSRVELHHEKSNLGLLAKPIYMNVVEHGILKTCETSGGPSHKAAVGLLAIIATYGPDEVLGAASNSPYALTRRLQENPRVHASLHNRARLKEALLYLEVKGLIARRDLDRPNYRLVQIWYVTPEGHALLQPPTPNQP